jgi:hypothetical protein
MKGFKDLVGKTDDAIPAFQFDSDGRKRTFLLADAYCDDPKCKGQEVLVYLLPDGKRTPGSEFWFDLFEGIVRWEEKPPEGAEAIALEFADDRTIRRLLVRRRQLVRASALVRGGREAVHKPGRTNCFKDFCPQNESYTMGFEFEGDEWDVLDQYCVNPGCECGDAYMTFYKIRDDRSVQEVDFVVQLDLTTGSAKNPEGSGPLSEFRRRALTAFQEELGDWRLELTRRREILRKIARNHLVAEREPAAVGAAIRSAKVGRNDPCPCGSGRKYKRCCGGA